MFRLSAAGLAGLLLSGCVSDTPSGLTDLASYGSAAEPTAAAPARYRSVIGGYEARTPTDPSGWRGTGVEIAPVSRPPATPSGPGEEGPTR